MTHENFCAPQQPTPRTTRHQKQLPHQTKTSNLDLLLAQTSNIPSSNNIELPKHTRTMAAITPPQTTS
jgi:hypothetical protein